MRTLVTKYQKGPTGLDPAQYTRLTKISDEAYKQNTVYCAWQNILANQSIAVPDTPTRKEEASTGDIPRPVR